MMYGKFTVLITRDENNKPFNVEVPGWLSESKCRELVKKHCKSDVILVDYLQACVGEMVSCEIHQRGFKK